MSGFDEGGLKFLSVIKVVSLKVGHISDIPSGLQDSGSYHRRRESGCLKIMLTIMTDGQELHQIMVCKISLTEWVVG